MTRNNSERFSSEVVNLPVLDSIKSPSSSTVLVNLPSKGKFYPQEHPWKDKESVELKLMTLHQQDIITNRSYITANVVIDKLLESLLIDKVDLDKILVADKEALILAARIDGFGEDYRYTTLCLSCGNIIEDTTNLETILENSEIELSEDVEYTDLGFKVKLENYNITLFLRPMNSSDIKELDLLDEKQKKLNLSTQRSSNTLRKIIYKVEGIESVEELLSKLKPRDFQFIIKEYNKFIPSINKKINIKCKKENCGIEFQDDIVFSTELFWPE